MGFVTAFSRITLDMTVVTLVILFLPGFPPYTSFDDAINIPSAPPWTGPLQANEKLNLVDRLFENKLKGPESFAVWDGYLFTGLISGHIVKIDTELLTVETVAKIGGDCAGQHEEHKCGRPLGMAFTKSGHLLVCDAVFGLFMLELDRKVETKGRIMDSKEVDRVGYTSLLPPDKLVNGSTPLVLNALALSDDNDTVYLTVTSTRFPLSDAMYEVMSDSSGQVLKFSLSTKEVEVLVTGVNFANGLELQPEKEEWIIFAETGRAKIHKHYLKGEKAGQTEVLVDNLPGLPDNIKLNDNGNYYIGLQSPRIPGKHHVLELLGPHNLLRKFIARLMSMVMMPVKVLNSVIPTTMCLRFEYWCGNLEPIAHLAPPYGLVVEIEGETGQIVSSMHSTNGAVRFIAEAFVHDRWIYFGSPYTTYLARIPKRLRYTSPQKSSAGVTLGLLNDPEPSETVKQPSETVKLPSETVELPVDHLQI